MSVNASIMKATLSGALTYGMFSYALPSEPNKTYFTIGSAVGSYLGDSIISNSDCSYWGSSFNE